VRDNFKKASCETRGKYEVQQINEFNEMNVLLEHGRMLFLVDPPPLFLYISV
jgi:hypothetical protein